MTVRTILDRTDASMMHFSDNGAECDQCGTTCYRYCPAEWRPDVTVAVCAACNTESGFPFTIDGDTWARDVSAAHRAQRGAE